MKRLCLHLNTRLFGVLVLIALVIPVNIEGAVAAEGMQSQDVSEGNAYAKGVGLDLTSTAEDDFSSEGKDSQYAENNGFQDFEVHFLISLPFTALYSYLSILSLDSMVQGKFPPEFHLADTWMIVGVAIGSSLAIALGSIDRVPDQSQYRLQTRKEPGVKGETSIKSSCTRIEFVRMNY
jgi:hypothetical protein